MRRPVLTLPKKPMDVTSGGATDAVVKALVDTEAGPYSGMSNLLGVPLNSKPQEKAE